MTSRRPWESFFLPLLPPPLLTACLSHCWRCRCSPALQMVSTNQKAGPLSPDPSCQSARHSKLYFLRPSWDGEVGETETVWLTPRGLSGFEVQVAWGAAASTVPVKSGPGRWWGSSTPSLESSAGRIRSWPVSDRAYLTWTSWRLLTYYIAEILLFIYFR